MKPDLGGRIALLRRRRGLTQEQLAQELGVSAPAVSKWETNHSCPDITILCPLARALGTTVDTLLQFEEEPDRQEIARKVKEIVETGREEGWEKAERILEEWLHQYPSSASVKFNGSGILALFDIMFPEESQKKREEWKEQRKKLLRFLSCSGDESYRHHAFHDMALLELQEGQLLEAEKLLEEIPREEIDTTLLKTRIYLEKGQREEALKLLQEKLYTVLVQAHNYMIMMTGEKITPDSEKALEIGKICHGFEKLFGGRFGMGLGILMELYMRLGKKEEALDVLDEYVKQIVKEAEPLNSVLFSPGVTMEKGKPATTKEMRHMFLQGLQTEKSFEDFREDPRYQEAVKTLEESLKGSL